MKLAFVFPGQGSQSVGMMSSLAETHPVVHETFLAASNVLGYDLWQIVTEGPEAELNKTHITQPAMLAAGVSTWRVWCEKTAVRPDVLAGHSLGEYTALVCAGSISFDDAIDLVAERGRFMQNAVPEGEGAMAAILGASDEDVIQHCDAVAEGEVLSAVNFNSPGQVVIAGNAAAIDRFIQSSKAIGVKRAVKLPVSVPSHSQLMEPAAHDLAERLQKSSMTTPTIAVVNNVDVKRETDPLAISDALIRQLCNPVRWVDTVNAIVADDVGIVAECGPGKILAGLNKRINRNIDTVGIVSDESLQQLLDLINQHQGDICEPTG